MPNLQHFVEVEGRLQLRVLPAAQLDIAVRATKDAAHSKLRLGQPFVLELDAEWSAHVLVLQHVQQIWAALPFAATSVSGKIPGGTSVIPADGEGNPLVEDNHVGTHRFVALLAGVRFPADFIAVAQQGLQLDRAALAMLAEFYHKQPPARRAIEVLTVDVRC